MKQLISVITLALVALALGGQSQQVQAADLGLGGLLGGVGDTVGQLTNTLVGNAGVGGVLNTASNMVGGITKPVMGMLGSLTGGPTGALSQITNTPLSMTSGLLNNLGGSLGGGAAAAAAAGGYNAASANNAAAAANIAAEQQSLTGNYGNMQNAAIAGMAMRNNIYKREAIDSGLSGLAGSHMRQNYLGDPAAAAAAAAAASRFGASSELEAAHSAAALGTQAAMANEIAQGSSLSVAHGLDSAAGMAGAAAAAGSAAANLASQGGLGSSVGFMGANPMGSAAAAAGAAAAAVAGSAESATAANLGLVANQQALARQALTADAMGNARSEAALAGADMVAHGANNARSASLASNAYRQAKLASARDRVNVAGTIQNSARISDAAIATHDAATKAEDSLLGSELAVDSASTVLDSDAAYIPPVTSSLLRSLPYGRLGIRNIIPKPLTYPSVLLPDVWLNGVPVNYLNVPLRLLPYTVAPASVTNPLWQSGAALANGQIINGQPFIANNGRILNGMVFDPAVAYLTGHLNGAVGSSIVPILANGQLEAQDEIALANLVTMQQLGGAGMSGTYQGYGRTNPVPMITGSVSDVNLMPTTTIGTTYPIGSALVIEPRDSYFQDYVDNASSRQNFDERQQ